MYQILDMHEKRERQTKQEFTDWMIDDSMTELISGLTHERVLMQDAVRELGLRMGATDTFLNDIRKRVPKAGSVIDYENEKIENDPKRKMMKHVQ